MKIAFLLGSGVSVPAGYPSLNEITNQVISGDGIYHENDGTYSFNVSSNVKMGFKDEYVPRIIVFLNRIKVEIDLYYYKVYNHFTNYEDLYYVATQISDSETFEYDNPIAKPFIDKIYPDLKILLKGKKSEIRSHWELYELADETTKYIHDIVWSMLFKEPIESEYLTIFKEFCLDSDFSEIDFYTLNHDTLIEQVLSGSGIKVNDGFSDPKNMMRRFDSSIFSSTKDKIRLLKLHGSVNWFRYRPDGGDWSNEFIGIPLKNDFWHIHDSAGSFNFPIDGRPKLLIGTYNKMLSYVGGIYSELHFQFYNLLKNKNTLIIIGYGFGDRGINTKIIDWIYSNNQNKIIVIHPELKRLKQNAKGSISNKWDNWIKEGKLFTIEKYIENTSKTDITNILNSS